MRTLIAEYQTHADRFGAVIESADGVDWSAPSPCDGWSAIDVLDHVVDTQRDFLQRQGVDLGPRPTGAPEAVWSAHRKVVDEVVTDDDFVTTEYDGYFGRTSVEDTLSNFFGFDLLVHRWDLGTALGQDVTWTDVELDRVEQLIEASGDNLYLEGVCKQAIDVPDDASRQVKLLGRLGRCA
jgi:uncharacterized protein (TIGR03086 family)